MSFFSVGFIVSVGGVVGVDDGCDDGEEGEADDEALQNVRVALLPAGVETELMAHTPGLEREGKGEREGKEEERR